MKQISLSIPYEEEKIEAIRQFAAAGKPSLEQELIALIDRLYHKTVPAPVKDYIAARTETSPSTTPARRKPRATGSAKTALEPHDPKKSADAGC